MSAVTLAALSPRRARPHQGETFVMPVSHDMFFPLADCQAEQRLIPGTLASIDGHLGLFGTDSEMLAQIDKNLLELLATPTT